jgi:hypothetical protein
MANTTIKQPLQHKTYYFTYHATAGWQNINENSTLINGNLPPKPYNEAIFTIFNRSLNSAKNAEVMTDGNDISLYSEIEQNIGVKWHRFVEG